MNLSIEKHSSPSSHSSHRAEESNHNLQDHDQSLSVPNHTVLRSKKASLSIKNTHPLAGKRINGHFFIESHLATGGMAEIFLARHCYLDFPVIIKALCAEKARCKDSVARFRCEANILFSLYHPYICRVFDYFEETLAPESPEQPPFFLIGIVMEYARLGDLGKLIQPTLASHSRPVPVEKIVSIFLPILDAMDHAHEQGIIHRDLKPSNLLWFEDGMAKISDFGIAKSFGHPSLTQAGMVVGSLAYMSPEQCDSSQPLDHRTDIYSIGVILYEMATGSLPFWGNDQSVLYQKNFLDPPLLSSILPHIPPSFEAVVLRCLAKNPEQRFTSCKALREVLSQVRDTLDLPSAHLTKYLDPETSQETAFLPLNSSPVLAHQASQHHDSLSYPKLHGNELSHAVPTADPRAMSTPTPSMEPKNNLSTADSLAVSNTKNRALVWLYILIPLCATFLVAGLAILFWGDNFLCFFRHCNAQLCTHHNCSVQFQDRRMIVRQHKVTQQEFFQLMGYNPSFFRENGTHRPVEQVTWHEAAAYCNALSRKNSFPTCFHCHSQDKQVRCRVKKNYIQCRGYRLLTPQEWEHMARSNSRGTVHTIRGSDGKSVVLPELQDIAWFQDNSRERTHPVGLKKPNLWGFEVLGNVAEWSSQPDTTSTTQSVHGCSWADGTYTCTLSERTDQNPSHFNNKIGFRVCRSISN